METDYQLVELQQEHAQPVMAIFNHYVETDFSAYFDKALPENFFGNMLEAMRGYPALAVKLGDEVVGFAFLHAYHPAPTFSRCAEVSYFIHPDHTRKGLGRMLLDALLRDAPGKGIDTLIANISSLNPRSLAFHSKYGFTECGRLHAVGRKMGRDFDVVYMQLTLAGQ